MDWVGRELALLRGFPVGGVHTPGRGEEALRRNRVSIPEASYFLTLCTARRAVGLTCPHIAAEIRHELYELERDGHWIQRGGVIMPDHLHLFVRLAGELPISRCVARAKTKTKTLLHVAGLAWQKNFYEHRLRSLDSEQEVLRYLFLNPFQAGVAHPEQSYPWFWSGAEEAEWFAPTEAGKPFPEWLR